MRMGQKMGIFLVPWLAKRGAYRDDIFGPFLAPSAANEIERADFEFFLEPRRPSRPRGSRTYGPRAAGKKFEPVGRRSTGSNFRVDSLSV